MLRAWAHNQFWYLKEDTFIFENEFKTRSYSKEHLGKDAYIMRRTDVLDKDDQMIYEDDYVVIGDNWIAGVIILDKGKFVICYKGRGNITIELDDSRVEYLKVVGNTMRGIDDGFRD